MSQIPSDPSRPRKKPPQPRDPDSPLAGEPTTFRPAKPRPNTAGAGAETPLGGRARVVEGGPNWFERILFGSVSTGHLALFCRQAGTYLDAGVDLVKALQSLEQQFARTALGPVIGRIVLAVRRGDELSDAMAREPAAFDAFFLSMMRVAEARGGVPETLRRMAQHYEARQRLIRTARSAMIYPTAVILISLVVGWLLTAFVLPKLVGLLEDMVRGRAAVLPAPTRMLMAFSHFVQRIGWLVLPLALFGGAFLLYRWYRTAAGKALLDRAALNVPVLGTLLAKIETTRMARSLSALLEAGVDYGASLDLTADVLRTAPYRNAIREARQDVVEGSELSETLAASRRFTPDVIAVVETGESTGKLPETLHRLADDYEEQVAHMVKNLGSLVQPLIVIILGGIVGFIVIAFVMAYIAAITTMAAGGL